MAQLRIHLPLFFLFVLFSYCTAAYSKHERDTKQSVFNGPVDWMKDDGFIRLFYEPMRRALTSEDTELLLSLIDPNVQFFVNNKKPSGAGGVANSQLWEATFVLFKYSDFFVDYAFALGPHEAVVKLGWTITKKETGDSISLVVADHFLANPKGQVIWWDRVVDSVAHDKFNQFRFEALQATGAHITSPPLTHPDL